MKHSIVHRDMGSRLLGEIIDGGSGIDVLCRNASLWFLNGLDSGSKLEKS
jgi:hypothetical protein